MLSDISLNQELKRIALQNKFEGNTVNTHQNIKEYNGRPWGTKRALDSTRRSESTDDALDELSEALQNILHTKDNDEEHIINIGNALQRVAIQNNIKGDTVNTNQNVQEYNEELVRAIDKPGPEKKKMDRRQNQRLKNNLEKIAEELRRIAIKNDIKGKEVNTHQNIEEYNDEIVKTIVRAIKRMAIKNDIKGSKVNTHQNVKEYNDNEYRRVAPRIAIGNQISGNIVSTKQNLAEINNDDPDNNDDVSETAKTLKVLLTTPAHVSIKKNNKSNDTDELDAHSEQPKTNVKIGIKKDKGKISTELKEQKDTKANTRRSMGMNPYSRSNMNYMQQRMNDFLMSQQSRSSPFYSADNSRWNYGQRKNFPSSEARRMFSDETFSDEDGETASNDELAEGEVNAESRPQSVERKTENINKKSSKKANEKDDEVEKIQNDQLVEGEINAQRRNSRRIVTATNNNYTRRSGENIESKVKQPSDDSSSPISDSLKDFECKLKDGKKISDTDLREFLNLLEKVKAAQKTTDVTETPN